MPSHLRLTMPSAPTSALLLSTLLLAACSGEGKAPAATQTAARVNKSEITVHQINFVLQQQPGLRPEQLDAASKETLERLIDQELALQKAEDLKLDRDPQTVQLLEAARRQVLAKAYVDRVGEGAGKPSPEAINKYYADNPALFRERRIYTLQEIGIEAKAEQIPDLQRRLQASASIPEFVNQLKASGLRHAGSQVIRPAEQIPLALLPRIAALKDGQSVVVPTAAGLQVIVLTSSRAEPVDIERARPAIENFLLIDTRRKLVETDIKSMRAEAKIAYKGKFEPTAVADAAATAPAAQVTPVAAPAIVPTSTVTTSTGGMTADDIAKGMKLK